jgi:hypothetical protein
MRTSPKRTAHIVGLESESERHPRAVLRLMAYATEKGHGVRLTQASAESNQNSFWYLVITPNNIED